MVGLEIEEDGALGDRLSGGSVELFGAGVGFRADRRVVLLLGHLVSDGVGDDWRACGRARSEMSDRELGASIAVSRLRLSLLSVGG